MNWKSLFGAKKEKVQNQEIILPEQESEKAQETESLNEMIWIKRMLAHNIRMPMSVISGYGELLKQGLLKEEEQDKCIRSICENITYMNQILSAILEGKIETGICPVRLNIVELIRKMKYYVQDIAEKISIRIIVNAKEKELYMYAEVVPMMRVFYQLFENAFKYLDSGNEIQIIVYPIEDEQIMIVFKDNGRGVAKSELQFLFEEGFRGKNRGQKPGSGFGLYEVRNIVEHYQGTISAYGAEGRGLSIVMIFPSAGKDAAEEVEYE